MENGNLRGRIDMLRASVAMPRHEISKLNVQKYYESSSLKIFLTTMAQQMVSLHIAAGERVDVLMLSLMDGP